MLGKSERRRIHGLILATLLHGGGPLLMVFLAERPTPTTRQVSSGGPPPQVLRDPGQPQVVDSNNCRSKPTDYRPSRRQGDEISYCDNRDRYRSLATSLGFEGAHEVGRGDAPMTAVGPQQAIPAVGCPCGRVRTEEMAVQPLAAAGAVFSLHQAAKASTMCSTTGRFRSIPRWPTPATVMVSAVA